MNAIKELLGIGQPPIELTALQVGVRALIMFVIALALVRFANKRFLSQMTAFDAILGFMLASVLARAINGSAAFVPSVVGSTLLVVLHRIIARISVKSGPFGNLVKGHVNVLVRDGKPDVNTMRAHAISEEDVLEGARLNGRVGSIGEIKLATLERNGDISVIPAL